LKGRKRYVTDRIEYKFIHKGDFKEYMIEKWDNSLPPEYINVFEANLQASADYQFQCYPGNLTLFRCQIQPQNQALSADLSWSDLVNGEIEIYPIAAPHYDMLLEPHVRFLAEDLKKCIDRSILGK
jgi:hypothetical protein